jgi:excisionase family DNA binding protein
MSKRVYNSGEEVQEVVTVHEAAERLGCSYRTVRRKISLGELTAVQLGGPGCHIRIPRVGLDAWLWSGGRLRMPRAHAVRQEVKE